MSAEEPSHKAVMAASVNQLRSSTGKMGVRLTRGQAESSVLVAAIRSPQPPGPRILRQPPQVLKSSVLAAASSSPPAPQPPGLTRKQREILIKCEQKRAGREKRTAKRVSGWAEATEWLRRYKGYLPKEV